MPSLLVDVTDEDVGAVFATNIGGTIACTRAALPHMLRARSGVIVNVSSVAAERPSRGQAVYAASKGAIESFTRAVAVEYGRKGHPLPLRPARRDRHGHARVDAGRRGGGNAAAHSDAARRGASRKWRSVVAFLLSDAASYVTGAIHPVDGGFGAGW